MTVVRPDLALGEGVAVGVAGAALGWVAWRPLGHEVALAAAVVGGANGLVSGARRVYDWRRPAGPVALVLDSTWGAVGTSAALLVHALHRGRRDRGAFRADLSERRGHHVYGTGVHLKRGFAMAFGNVVTNAAGRAGLDPGTAAGLRRRRFVVAHEGLHVWQSRAFGPLYPALYAAWAVGGAVVATLVWLRHRDEPWARLVETAAYYDNPFEVWAYRNDGKWPPAGAHPRLVWRLGPPAPEPLRR